MTIHLIVLTRRGMTDHPVLLLHHGPDDDEGQFRHHTVALDSSGKGNHLPLLNPPIPLEDTINMPGE
jgi:hypothetical protein